MSATHPRREWPRGIMGLGLIAALMIVPVIILRAPGFIFEPGEVIFLLILFATVAIAQQIVGRVPAHRAFAVGVGLALFTGLAQLWLNLAVGTIASEDDPANLIYLAVVALALIGAAVGRFRPQGMAGAMVGAAIAQCVAFFVALAAGWGFTGPITICFASLWLIAATAFRRSAGQSRSG